MESNITRRKMLAAVGATSAVTVSGCVAEEEESAYNPNVIHTADDGDLGCVQSVETANSDDGFFILEGDAELVFDLKSNPGYGKIVAEWQDSMGDYEKSMATIDRGDEEVTLWIEGTPNYVHVTAGCEASDERDFLIEFEDADGGDTDE